MPSKVRGAALARNLKVPMAAPNMRIGLLGGSFNPAHAAHRQISLAALKRLRLDQVWWLVSPNNPLKAKAPDLETRITIAREVAHHPKIVVTGFEGARAGASRGKSAYTVDTIRFLKRRYPSVNFVWLMGANLVSFHRGGAAETLFRLVPIAVLTVRATGSKRGRAGPRSASPLPPSMRLMHRGFRAWNRRPGLCLPFRSPASRRRGCAAAKKPRTVSGQASKSRQGCKERGQEGGEGRQASREERLAQSRRSATPKPQREVRRKRDNTNY